MRVLVAVLLALGVLGAVASVQAIPTNPCVIHPVNPCLGR